MEVAADELLFAVGAEKEIEQPEIAVPCV